ncbi:MAG: type phosphodiesterase/nucleotide pyrophosphatase family protein [Verrucomicrobiaceae bacterium]|nr:type phosphodiesterase/nucleotide pyrophosphatase family protein [Verrucomicrobiaceae bacterium]
MVSMKPFLFIAILFAASQGIARAADPVTDRTVVLVSVDGLAHYYLDDPKAEMPNIRRLASEGARAEKMKAVMPSVTWPNHTSLVTGVTPAKHGVVGNDFLDRDSHEIVTLIWDPVLDKEQLIKVPTIYDVAKQAGLTTAAVTWPGSRSAKSLDWTVPCVNSSEHFIQYSTPSLLEEFKAAGIPYEHEADGFKKGEGQNRDRLHLRMLRYILATHRPQLALMHILEVDHVEHAHGPQSPEAYEAVKFADGLVGEIREELEHSFPGKATLVVVSDHGFMPYRQVIHPNVVLRKAGWLTAVSSKITGGQVRSVSQGGSTLIYVTDTAHRDALIPRVAAAFKEVEGVKLILTPADFPKYGFGDPTAQPRMADLVLSAKEGYMFDGLAAEDEVTSAPAEITRGIHGHDPNEPKLHATFVAWGAGIKAGARTGTITNTCVAPTIAALLGLKMTDTDGQAVSDILAP